MNVAGVIVLVAAAAAIAGSGGSSSASAAELSGGAQRAQVTIRGGYRPGLIRAVSPAPDAAGPAGRQTHPLVPAHLAETPMTASARLGRRRIHA